MTRLNIITVRIFSSFDFFELLPVNRDVSVREHPKPVRPFLPEIEQFARHNHFNVLHPILR